jgi:hypothetical protein
MSQITNIYSRSAVSRRRSSSHFEVVKIALPDYLFRPRTQDLRPKHYHSPLSILSSLFCSSGSIPSFQAQETLFRGSIPHFEHESELFRKNRGTNNNSHLPRPVYLCTCLQFSQSPVTFTDYSPISIHYSLLEPFVPNPIPFSRTKTTRKKKKKTKRIFNFHLHLSSFQSATDVLIRHLRWDLPSPIPSRQSLLILSLSLSPVTDHPRSTVYRLRSYSQSPIPISLIAFRLSPFAYRL